MMRPHHRLGISKFPHILPPQRLTVLLESRIEFMVEATTIFGDDLPAFGEGNPFGKDVLENLPLEQQGRLDELSGAGPRRRERELGELRAKYPIDSLTGLSLFHNELTQSNIKSRLEEAARHGHETWVVMFDLDRFKAVNDEHGHPFGNKVLKAFAEALKKSCRSSDLPMRYGGEEFALVLFNGEGFLPVEVVVERLYNTYLDELGGLRSSLDDPTFCAGASRVRLTEESERQGGKVIKVRKSEPIEGTTERSDGLLYAAKENGRAQVYIEGKEPILLKGSGI